MPEELTPSAAVALAEADAGLAVVATLRADGTMQASMVNIGLLEHPDTAESVLGFVTYGVVKLNNLRARPQVTMTFSRGWTWATVEGTAEIVGPHDPRPWLDSERLRLLRREVFIAAGGTHDNWPEYDSVMAEQSRSVVLVRPARVYGS